MTKELKALMERESDRADNYFTLDPEAILAAGRRRSRVRTLGVAATLLTVLVVLTAGTSLVLQEREAPVAGLPSRPQDAYKQCDTSSGRRLGKESWTWPEVRNAIDDYGSASLRRDPDDPGQVAYCVTQPDVPVGFLPLAQQKGIVVRVTPIDTKTRVVTVAGRTYVSDGGTVLVAVGGVGERLLPSTLNTRFADSAATASVGEAGITGTYYLYRTVQHAPWPGPQPEVSVASYQPNGYMISFGTW
ncbi:hypothetical protein GCM10029976_077700 [Kribbella albertanoniae]|uniref:Uncharacterized protein n=1 Tax=Kribbella albertanoniae TaxID=1266829 RepID=A0A4R4Q6B5_9ACTN|nr:hypothetical protein [Kribbella albertanoniae]TDC30539.1 hypothetical protein E1261_13175 [Kribbella albertanoniae]